jgi:hypothetical protein
MAAPEGLEQGQILSEGGHPGRLERGVRPRPIREYENYERLGNTMVIVHS